MGNLYDTGSFLCSWWLDQSTCWHRTIPLRQLFVLGCDRGSTGAIAPLSLGYAFAETWEEVAGLFGAFSGLLLTLLIAIALSILLVQKIRQRRRAPTVEEEIDDASKVFTDEAACDINPLLTRQIKRP